MSGATGTTNVAVLGAGGRIAPALVRDLADSPEVATMRLLDIAGDRAAAVAAAQGLGKAEAVALDARSGDLAAAIEGCDVLANCASYRLNLDAMKACLKAGCHYLDLGGLYWMTGKQMELHDKYEKAGLLALLGIGSSPGKTNVMAVRAARELPAVEALHVSAAGRDLDPPPGLSVPYALATLIDELTLRPVVLREGEAVEIEPMSPEGKLTSAIRSEGRRRSTRCTRSCVPSGTASAAARRASGSRCRKRCSRAWWISRMLHLPNSSRWTGRHSRRRREPSRRMSSRHSATAGECG